jgi:putative ATP-dependent endonuclease of the OLD family
MAAASLACFGRTTLGAEIDLGRMAKPTPRRTGYVARIARITLENYRSFRSASFPLSEQALLIGANNTGKTSVLEAIDKVFGVGRRGYGFEESDLHQDGKPIEQPRQLRVEFELRPSTSGGSIFTAEEHALFETHIDFDQDGAEVVLVRATAGHEADGVFRSRAVFLKRDGEDDGLLDQQMRQRLKFFYLPALRDVRRELDDRSGLWSRLAGLLETAHDPERVAQLTDVAGRELVEAILGPERLGELGEHVTEALATVLYLEGENVSAELRATSLDFRTLLRRASLVVGGPGDQEPLPVDRQSTGVQALALFGLFRSYLETQGGHVLAIGLEEPEAHLSPHAIRSLVTLACAGDTQTILTTHAPIVADALDPRDVVLLRRHGQKTTARVVPAGTFNEEEALHLRRVVCTASSSFLFGRAVLLVEGPTERWALPEFARQLWLNLDDLSQSKAKQEGPVEFKRPLDLDLDRLGITIVEVSGATFSPFLRLLSGDCLDIPHCVVTDNDQTAQTLVRQLAKLGRLPHGFDSDQPDPTFLETLGVFRWSQPDFEQYLVAIGGYPAYEAAADLLYGPRRLAAFRKRRTEVGDDDSEAATIKHFVKQRDIRKPELALEASQQFAVLGLPVPDEVVKILTAVTRLALANVRASRGG